MDTALLATKLYLPPASPKRVLRPRLLARLNEGLTCPLTLLSAPAGFGKTTLLSQWIATTQLPVAWLSLDEGDNDLARFVAYLIGALETIFPDVGRATRQLLQSPPLPSHEALLTPLVNEIAAIPQPAILVLDDLHCVDDTSVHRALGFLLDHLPPQFHIIVASRADPMVSLARLRARNQLVELRAGDLRFTNEQAADFLNRSMGLNLSAADIALLGQRTEGWIAGLQMAALSMRGRQDLSSFVAAFTGDHRFVLDYLTDQVLERQSEQIQRFLLQTSVLDHLSGSLCDAVVDGANSQTILEELERTNVFVVPLDDERRWYRYHHLFADLLRSRLNLLQPNPTMELRRRAAIWFEQAGLAEEAVRYALSAQDHSLATCLIEQVGYELYRRGQVLTMVNWFRTVPEELVRSHPHSCLQYAESLGLTGQFQAAETWLNYLEEHIRNAATYRTQWSGRYTAEQASILLDAFRSIIARFRGNLPEAIALSQRALDKVAPNDLRLRGIALLFHAHAHWYAGDGSIAHPLLLQAIEMNRSSGHIAACLNASHHLAQLYVLHGQLHQAKVIYDQAVEYSEAQTQPVLVGIERAGIGDLYREWNELERARTLIQEGLELAEAGGDIFFLRDCYIARIRLALAQRDGQTALGFIQKAEQIAQRSPLSTDLAILQAWRARLQLAQGDVPGATYWAQTCGLNPQAELTFFDEFRYLTLARVWLAQGNGAQAIELLERLHPFAMNAGRIGRVIEILMLQAQAFDGLGKRAQSLAALAQALQLAEPEGYVRSFLDEGLPIAQLLVELGTHNGASKYSARLVTAFDPIALKQPLIEPLTDREIQVLRLVARGCSNQDIADQLVVALGTVKTHLSNIFGKLDAQNRTQAIARARALGLLSE